ncbi:18689_t:CDS:2 [Entrophospora sp. SA101]|nr:18689_t:CDS:2 [Entrophospora sp. SA101]
MSKYSVSKFQCYSSITDNTIKEIANSCHKLEHLDIYDFKCPDLDSEWSDSDSEWSDEENE